MCSLLRTLQSVFNDLNEVTMRSSLSSTTSRERPHSGGPTGRRSQFDKRTQSISSHIMYPSLCPLVFSPLSPSLVLLSTPCVCPPFASSFFVPLSPFLFPYSLLTVSQSLLDLLFPSSSSSFFVPLSPFLFLASLTDYVSLLSVSPLPLPYLACLFSLVYCIMNAI